MGMRKGQNTRAYGIVAIIIEKKLILQAVPINRIIGLFLRFYLLSHVLETDLNMNGLLPSQEDLR